MRIHQFLARAGIASRRKAEDLIRDGRIEIDGVVAGIGDTITDSSVITYDGERIRLPLRTVVIALNKPKGYTTTNEDRHADQLVFELLPEIPGLHAIGRLDKDTEGLLLLTNDGSLTHMVSHPSNGVPKLYRAWSKRNRLTESECQKLVDGVQLSDGVAKALEAIPIKDGVKLVMNEGRKREVRRMLGKIGHPVKSLVRLAVGVIELQDLPVGEYRYLTAEEIQMLRDNVTPPKLRSEKKMAEARDKVRYQTKKAEAKKAKAEEQNALEERTKRYVETKMRRWEQLEASEATETREARNFKRDGSGSDRTERGERNERPARGAGSEDRKRSYQDRGERNGSESRTTKYEDRGERSPRTERSSSGSRKPRYQGEESSNGRSERNPRGPRTERSGASEGRKPRYQNEERSNSRSERPSREERPDKRLKNTEEVSQRDFRSVRPSRERPEGASDGGRSNKRGFKGSSEDGPRREDTKSGKRERPAKRSSSERPSRGEKPQAKGGKKPTRKSGRDS